MLRLEQVRVPSAAATTDLGSCNLEKYPEKFPLWKMPSHKIWTQKNIKFKFHVLKMNVGMSQKITSWRTIMSHETISKQKCCKLETFRDLLKKNLDKKQKIK